MIMFGTGLIVTVLSILRLQSLVAYTDHNNFTWVYVTTGAWVGLLDSSPSSRTLLTTLSPNWN